MCILAISGDQSQDPSIATQQAYVGQLFYSVPLVHFTLFTTSVPICVLGTYLCETDIKLSHPSTFYQVIGCPQGSCCKIWQYFQVFIHSKLNSQFQFLKYMYILLCHLYVVQQTPSTLYVQLEAKVLNPRDVTPIVNKSCNIGCCVYNINISNHPKYDFFKVQSLKQLCINGIRGLNTFAHFGPIRKLMDAELIEQSL